MSEAHAVEPQRPDVFSAHQEAIVELGVRALREPDVDRLLQHAAEVLAALLEVEYCKVLELLPRGDELLLRAGTGWKRGLVGRLTVPAGTGSQAGYTLVASGPVVVSDLRTDTRFEGPELLHDHKVVSGMSVVIAGESERPFGVLGAHTTQLRAFTADHVNLLQSVANILAGAIRRASQERALRVAEAKYRNLVEGLPLVTYIDALDTISSVYASPQIEPLLGYSPAEWAADPDMFAKRLHPEDRERVLAEHARLRETGERLRTEYRMVARDERVVWVRDEATVVADELGAATLLQGVLLDVTEQKRLEEQLRQSQRMEAVGRLAGGIAHDFNNLLTAILGYAEFVLVRLPADDPLRADVGEIVTAGNRAAELTSQLLALSRKQVLQPRVVNLSDVVSGMERILRRLLGERIKLVTTLETELGGTMADPGRLEQVILNLAVNARDAMPKGGTLTVETANVEIDETVADRYVAELARGPYVRLTVSDTGVGMDAATLRRIFEPFFTTKPMGEGTGLGLSTVYGIVKQSGGAIWVYSEPGVGSAFRVYLPRAGDEEATPPSSSPATSTAPLEGSETIVLVEDELRVRDLVARELESRGFTVLVAAGYDHALELVDDRAREVDLVLTDVVMPDGSGFELAEQIVRRYPRIRVLYMSGYAGSTLDQGTFPGRVLQKPFNAHELVTAVREVIDAR